MVINVAQLKPCYDTAVEMDREQRRQILKICDEEDSPGFPASGMEEDSIIKKKTKLFTHEANL